MPAVDHIKHYTYDDYKLWEGAWELHEGYPVAISPAPMINHQILVVKFIAQIDDQLDT